MSSKPLHKIRDFAARCKFTSIGLLVALAAMASHTRGQGYSGSEASQHFQVPTGFEAQVIASEPLVRQPILVKFDDRGRLWTIQYLQYPNPAGLERVKVDRWSRTVYDRVPEPPPRGPRGDDVITILEDTDDDGRMDRAKNFVTGLNLTTGIEFGYGGVFVIQVPYLLFYPDRDRDDVPDGDPDVLLEGFGMEDAQSLANHLTWGPDGWLYGVTGSTTTNRIRDLEFQQGVWRYHPRTKQFELFCEGGGNLFGLTFDANGNLFYSSNGGYLNFHGVQGGYYEKTFGKHGPLHNPYTYGYFPPIRKDAVAAGAPSTGGTIYLGDSLPPHMLGVFICGNFLGHSVSWWKLAPAGSTFAASLGGKLLDTHDTWSCPTDLCLGPDGAIYVCDFYDQRTAHPDPDANWDRSNGRIYRIATPGTPQRPTRDLNKIPSSELIQEFANPNRWYVQRARRILAERRDASQIADLARTSQADDGDRSQQALLALYQTGGMSENIAQKLLEHPSESSRFWTVRLLGDQGAVSRLLGDELVRLAQHESSPRVRSQIASSAKRLPASFALPILGALVERNIDQLDPMIPLLIWWAVESKAISDRDAVLEHFLHPSRENPLLALLQRNLVRRYAAEGTEVGYHSCHRILDRLGDSSNPELLAALADGLAQRGVGLAGIGHGTLFENLTSQPTKTNVEQPYEPIRGDLLALIESTWKKSPDNVFALRLGFLAEIDGVHDHALELAVGKATDRELRKQVLDLLRVHARSSSGDELLKLVGSPHPDEIQIAALKILGRFPAVERANQILGIYSRLGPAVQNAARDELLGHPASARAFLQAVDTDAIPPASVAVEQLRRVPLFGEPDLDALVRKHWGNITPGTAEEKLAVIRRYTNDLRAAAGHAVQGKELFQKHCSKCHKVFGQGGEGGPDLTTANRKDREFLLVSLVDPSAVIRNQYLNYVVLMLSGQVVTGILADQDGASVTLINANGERVRIAREEIDQMSESDASLMPERILESLAPQELRDLFQYLQSDP